MNPLDMILKFVLPAHLIGKGFTWVAEKGRFYDVSNQKEAKDLYREFPGKGKLYLVSTTKDVKWAGTEMLWGLEDLIKEGFGRQVIGGYAGKKGWELDATGPTRSKKKARMIKKKYDQTDIISIEADGTVDWDA